MGWALQAWESERVLPGTSGQVLKCSGQQLAPRLDGVEIFVGHAGVVQGAGQIEAEVIGGAQDAVGSGSRLDGQHLAQDFLLAVFGDDVVEDSQDVGLLAEVFLVRIVGDEAA